MKIKLINVLFSIVIIFLAESCYYDVQEELHPSANVITCDTVTVTYTSRIAPLLQSRCYSCHDAATQLGGVNLQTYSSLKGFVQSGQLLGSIMHDPAYTPMPQGQSKLSDCDIAMVQTWITNGAVND